MGQLMPKDPERIVSVSPNDDEPSGREREARAPGRYLAPRHRVKLGLAPNHYQDQRAKGSPTEAIPHRREIGSLGQGHGKIEVAGLGGGPDLADFHRLEAVVSWLRRGSRGGAEN